MTFVKFCGMTREEDVASAVTLGVNAVGFVLWPTSPRYLPIARAAALVATLPPEVTPVAVLVNPSAAQIAEAIDAGFRVVQIHGEAPAPVQPVTCEVWVAASLAGERISRDVDPGTTVLLDTHDPARHGGTGRTIDWSQAARVAATRRVMLAGGLTPINVADAIREVRPYGVDVASGIEDRPGVKNAHAMHAFVAAVRQADQ